MTTMGYNWKLNVTESTLYAADMNTTGGADWRVVQSNITVLWDASQLVVLLPVPLSANAVVEWKWWSGKEWAVPLTEPIDFMLYGDSAPNARFNYRYEVAQQSRLEQEEGADVGNRAVEG